MSTSKTVATHATTINLKNTIAMLLKSYRDGVLSMRYEHDSIVSEVFRLGRLDAMISALGGAEESSPLYSKTIAGFALALSAYTITADMHGVTENG